MNVIYKYTNNFSDLNVPEILIRTIDNDQFPTMPVRWKSTFSGIESKTVALLDSGASGLYLSRRYAEEKGIPCVALKQLIPVYNVDGTPN